MTVLVCIEASTGSFSRYEANGSKLRKTHSATQGCLSTFTKKFVEDIRVRPPDQFKEEGWITQDGNEVSA